MLDGYLMGGDEGAILPDTERAISDMLARLDPKRSKFVLEADAKGIRPDSLNCDFQAKLEMLPRYGVRNLEQSGRKRPIIDFDRNPRDRYIIARIFQDKYHRESNQ